MHHMTPSLRDLRETANNDDDNSRSYDFVFHTTLIYLLCGGDVKAKDRPLK